MFCSVQFGSVWFGSVLFGWVASCLVGLWQLRYVMFGRVGLSPVELGFVMADVSGCVRLR